MTEPEPHQPPTGPDFPENGIARLLQHAASVLDPVAIAECLEKLTGQTFWASYTRDMKEIAVSKFKEQCLALLDSLDEDGLLITKHGKPVARLVPVHVEYAELIGSMKDKIEIRGDILSPGLSWDAES